MTAHPHAESMRLFAEDAASSNTPYYLWECKHVDEPSTHWRQMAGMPDWDPMYCYRRKPKPAECWVFVSDGVVGPAYFTEQQARNYEGKANGYGWRLAHMREVTE